MPEIGLLPFARVAMDVATAVLPPSGVVSANINSRSHSCWPFFV